MKYKRIILAAALALALCLAAFPAAAADGRAAVQGRSLAELAGGAASAALRSAGMPALSEDTQVMGPACLETGAALSLGGHSLTVYGDLTIGGTLTLGGDKLTVCGNLIVEGGLLIMTNPADTVEVTGAMIAAGADETGMLSAGKIKISGDLIQLDTHSTKSYNETGSHATAFTGANKTVKFTNPLESGIRNPQIAAGVTFSSGGKTIRYQYTYINETGSVAVEDRSCAVDGTYFSLTSSLIANYTITVPNLYFTGSQNGFALAVRGKLIVPASASLSVTGSITATELDAQGGINQTAGTITVTGTYRRRLSADADPLTITPSGSALTITKDTAAQLTARAASAAFSGGIGGRRVVFTGSATVPGGASLRLDGGRIDVSGAMTVTGKLITSSQEDTVTVGGKFTANGEDSCGMTGGYLALRGGFEQTGAASAFHPTGSHRTLLCGAAGQGVVFANPGSSSFANLYVLNGAITETAMDHLPVSGIKAMTGTGLSGLTINGGAALPVYPAFSLAATAYEAVIPEGVTSVSITPTAAYGNAEAKLLGDAGTGGVSVPPEGNASVTITVLSAAGEPYEGAGAPFSSTVTVKLQPENTRLAGASASCALDTPFSPETTEYGADVSVKDARFSLTPITVNPNASIRFVCDGKVSTGASFAHGIEPGQEVAVDIVVTAYKNPAVAAPAERTYRFTFRREPLLTGIALSDGIAANEPFAWSRYAYTADIPAAQSSVTVTPGKGPGCASCFINGAATESVTLRPGFGSSATAEITLADASGAVKRIYRLTVRRPALLTGISIRSAIGARTVESALRPGFTSAVGNYTAYVPVNAGSVTVSGVQAIPGCLGVTVGGQPDEHTYDVPLDGSVTVPLEASAGDTPDLKAAYTVTLRKSFLSGIAVSSGRFTAPFSPDPSVASAITLPYTQSFVRFSPIGNDGGTGAVTVTYAEGGKPLGAGGSIMISLAQGQRRTIAVKAAYQGAVKTYTVGVTREKSNNANLASLGVSGGWLTPAVSASASNYTLLLPEWMRSVRIAPALADKTAKFRIGALAYGAPRTVSPALNRSIPVSITVTAARGNSRTYSVTVKRVSMLAAVTASPVTKGYPSLSPGEKRRLTFQYRLTMPAAVKLEVRKGGRWYTILKRTETSAGAKSFAWDGKAGGHSLGAGIYAVRMTPYWQGKAGTPKTMRVRILPRS